MDLDSQMVWMGVGGLIIGVMMAWYYYRARHLLDEVWTVDSYNAKELRRMCSHGFDATVEIDGEISCDTPVTAPATGVTCCWCRTMVEIPHEGSRDWKVVMDKTQHSIFKLTDETGYVLVNPLNADIETDDPYEVTTEVREPWFDSAAAAIPYSDNGLYRISEEFFIPAGYAHVLGQATSTQDGPDSDVVLHRPTDGYVDPKRRYFVVSRKSERELTQSQSLTATVCLWLSIASFLVAGLSALWLLNVIPHAA